MMTHRQLSSKLVREPEARTRPEFGDDVGNITIHVEAPTLAPAVR